MSGGPVTTTTSDNTADNRSTQNAQTNVQGTDLSQSSGQNYGLQSGQTQQQGVSGGASYTSNNAWAPAQPILTNILSQAGDIAKDSGLSSTETEALSGLRDQARSNTALAPQMQDAAGYMLGGAGFNDGDRFVNEGYDTAKAALDPYARGDYLDPSNPLLQQMLAMTRDDISNSVGSQFAGAGRSFSGAHAGQVSKGIAAGQAGHMMDWYNQQQSNQMGAANALAGIGNAASGAMGANRAGAVGAMQGAPGMLASTIDPYTTMLTGSQYARNAPLDTLGRVADITMPMGQAFGDQVNIEAGYNSNQGSAVTENFGANQNSELSQRDLLTMLSSLGTSTGSSTGNQVSSVQNDPLQVMLGAAMTGIGTYAGLA